MLFSWLPGHLHFLMLFLMYIDKFTCHQLFSCCTLIHQQLCFSLINLLSLELLVIWKEFLIFYQDLKFISLSLSSTIVSWCACICFFFLLPWLDAIFYIYNFIILGNSSTIPFKYCLSHCICVLSGISWIYFKIVMFDIIYINLSFIFSLIFSLYTHLDFFSDSIYSSQSFYLAIFNGIKMSIVFFKLFFINM